MIDDGKRVAAGGARLQWHMIPIADIDLIARNTRGEEDGVASKLRSVDSFASELTHPRPSGFAIYVARLPSAPFASRAFNISFGDVNPLNR